ncbi:potassium transporter TrkA [Plantactinospora sp. KBS50]|uniref:potassium transporter TrkA n=1 Tax=Plantactinospora sp. KBS50 TaxID=2024580 RepID=UPI000BAAFF3D|nr:potassium transporter TrkA [Plantactinospora sp. KBS50]ASW55659.1 hypothetical protein CIK06_17925 [Plantactinospora sp. KBS50]
MIRTVASVLVVGTGAFGRNVCRSLARSVSRPTVIDVAGRDPVAAATAAGLGATHARLAGAPVRFRPVVAPLEPDADLRPLLARLSPDVVLLCASLHPPAESRRDDAWSDLLRQAGFGVTLPLQAALAERVAADYAATHPDPTLINACFPDAVNPLLRHRGLPVLCGLGNVAALALGVRDQLGVADPARLTMLAHHAHLHRPSDPAAEAVGWLDGRPLGGLRRTLEPIRRLPRDLLNELSAWASGPLVAAVVQDEMYVGHLPGVCGLPGGYPVAVTGRSVALRLPGGMSERAAIRWNERAAELDGVAIGADGRATFTEPVVTALRRWWPAAPAAVDPDELPGLRAELLALRHRLRGRPAGGGCGGRTAAPLEPTRIG